MGQVHVQILRPDMNQRPREFSSKRGSANRAQVWGGSSVRANFAFGSRGEHGCTCKFCVWKGSMGHAHVQILRLEMMHGSRARANFASGNEIDTGRTQ